MTATPPGDAVIPGRGRRRALATAVAAIVMSVAFGGLVPAAAAHVDPPTVVAQHVFIGDPLFGLDTPQGTLFGILPDEETSMASTTKVWTFDLTAHALAEGKVHLDNLVTINAFEAGIGGSSMVDSNMKPLEKGEVVKLRDLIRGMMYRSDNKAAYAISRHVAQAYLGPNAGWQDFVAMMNAHAAALGQANTHFDNPAGGDGPPDDSTTARELAEQFQHGLQDPFFAQVESFNGTYTFATFGAPGGVKTYSFNWGRQDWYTGWEGEKGGGSVICSGSANGCAVMAATRIGRRVVLGEMQAKTNEEPEMLDYGFASIFHPDPRGTSSPLWSGVDRHDLDCFGPNAVTAVLPPTGPVRLDLWRPNVDASTVTKLQEALLPGSGNPARGSGDVAVTHLPSGDIILATRKGSNVELSRWTINRGGGLTLLASGIQAGAATTMGLQAVYGHTFLTSMTEPGGDLVLKSWRLQGSGLVNLDTFTLNGHHYKEVAVAEPLTTDVLQGHRAVTAALTDTHLFHNVWGVDQATGAIDKLGFRIDGGGSNVTISPFDVTPMFEGELPPAHYATAYRRSDGKLTISFYRIDAKGDPNLVGWANTDIAVDRVRLAPLGTGGVMSAIRDPQGYVQLVAWDAQRKPDDSIWPGSVAQHWTPGAVSLDLCRTPSAHAEGDFVTATKDLDGLLRLRIYRSGDRPY